MIHFPQTLKLICILFLSLLIPIYWHYYGPQNFLWFSDIGLFLTTFGIIFDSLLLLNIASITILPLEILWNIDFFGHLIMEKSFIFNLSAYMFDSNLPFGLRLLSLFHIAFPAILIWSLYSKGYEKRSLYYGLILIPITIFASFLVSTPQENINFVYGSTMNGWHISSFTWIVILIAASITMTIMMHAMLKMWCKQKIDL